jgi:sarcosine oxidase|tara:strand:- start:4031 stop:5224 length:1194 start_codon:yes stop_codon:yes gene_type:complete
MPKYEYAVIGAGLIGSAAAKYIATNNNNVILIGPKEPENKISHNGIFASHYDEGRITRIADSNTTWAYLSKKSIQNYDSIFKLSNIGFYTQVGQLSVGPKSNNKDSYINSILKSSETINYDYLHLNKEELNTRYYNLNFPNNSDFLLQMYDAGHISPRNLVKAQIKIFTDLNGTYLPSIVNKIKRINSSSFVIKTTDSYEIEVHKILVCGGGFTNFTKILPFELPLGIRGRTIVLGELKNIKLANHELYPSIIHKPDMPGRHYTYILPAIKYPDNKYYIKIGGSNYYTNINSYNESIAWFKSNGNDEEIGAITDELNTIYPKEIFEKYITSTCITTWTRSGYPIIDEIEKNIFVSVGGNGSAAKSSDYIGKISSDLILDYEWDTEVNKNLFKLDYSI